MSITDELREWASRELSYKTRFDELFAIANRIDAEHETTELQKESYRLDLKAANIAVGEAYKRGFDEGFASADDWLGQHESDMAEHGWVRLPKDADGVPWHIGDVTENGVVVNAMELDSHGWIFLCQNDIDPSIHRHYHAPTVEDVLTEFGIDWEHESDCEDRAARARWKLRHGIRPNRAERRAMEEDA